MEWRNKPYYSLNEYLQKTYQEKVYKISLNAGLTCPNRDGKIDTKGCIFCSHGGSGDFASSPNLTIPEQIESGIAFLSEKNTGQKYIAYFQAFTNTYAPISYLKKIFYEALNHPSIVCLSIATRPDCIDNEVLSLLSELNKIKPVWIELGLQTLHEKTAHFIRRGYSLHCFENTLALLNHFHIPVVVHLIIGLPYETREDIMNTIDYIAHKTVFGVKLQLLHILEGTDLGNLYNEGKIEVLSMNEYVQLIVNCIERLPEHMVIHRLTGDGPKNILLAPKWSSNKKVVLNEINKAFRLRETYQGKYYI